MATTVKIKSEYYNTDLSKASKSPEPKSPKKRGLAQEDSLPICKWSKSSSGELQIPDLTDQKLASIYKYVVPLGRHMGDFTSSVSAVEKQTLSGTKRKALKITIEKPPLSVLPILEQIRKANDTVHLTKTKLVGQIPRRTRSYLKINDPHGFVKEPKKDTSKLKAYVYEMPLMLGDLKNLKELGLSLQELAAFEIQRLAIECLLDQYGILADDLKDINVLYREVADQDQYKGKKICKADYWEYHIGDKIYYIPKPKYLIQLCDYDKWRRIQGPVRDFSHVIEERFARNPEMQKIFKQFENKPAGYKIRIVN